MANREYSKRLGWTKLDLASNESFGYLERLEFTQVLSGNIDSLDDRVIFTTTGTLNLYVGINGSDTNVGTDPNFPLRTIQAACDRMPEYYAHPINVWVGTGSFSGSWVCGTVAKFKSVTDPIVGAGVSIIGTMLTASLASGQPTGSMTSVSVGASQVFATITDTSQAWTQSDLKGRMIFIGSGGNTGQYRPISDNTANTITVVGSWSGLSAGNTYVIKDFGTHIQSGTQDPRDSMDPGDPNTGVFYSFSVNTPDVGVQGNGVQLFWMELNADRCVRVEGAGMVLIRGCRLNPSVSTVVSNLATAWVYIRYCDIPLKTNAKLFSQSNLRGRLQLAQSRLSGSGGASTAVFQGLSPMDAYLFNNEIQGVQNGCMMAPGSVVTAQFNRITSVPGSVFVGKQQPFTGVVEAGAGSDEGIVVNVDTNELTNNGIVADAGSGMAVRFHGGNTGGGNTTVYKLLDGARISISAADTVSGSTDINIDGATSTQATLRGLSPISTGSLTTFSRIWQV